ncbi:hypothetical protein Bca52824_090442 [Brassica carinata]|uniref:NmrA-like domain-containing protein n=1 Tax=Brassica carinata TaxID=52824 RepID=A0A8X7TGF6_BRACI|nr:hypothetical protein Bca52824_090442 [Brassica carinata]
MLNMEEEKKSRVLVIGATGRLGHYLTRFSIQSGHPTFALIRNSTFSDPSKSANLESLLRRRHSPQSLFLSPSTSLIKLKGSLDDEASLEEAVSKVDVVISAIPSKHVLDQTLLINVIKRTPPSRSDKTQVSDLDHGFYSKKSEIRRLVESSNIPYTCFVNEVDAAAFTIKTIDDPRTLNKTLYLRPSGNVCSMNDLVEMWEGKIEKKLVKTLLLRVNFEKIKETPYPDDMEMVFIYSVFIKGHHTYFEIDESCGGVNGTELYPDVKYMTVSEFLDTFSRIVTK